MTDRIKLIINPMANLGTAWKTMPRLRPVVDELGGADWFGTAYPTHATELASKAADEGYDVVVAMGGDGTVHEVVAGLMQIPAEKRPRLGVVPLGSGNDFSYGLGVSENPETALRQIFTGSPRAVDIGIFEDEHGHSQYWANAVGVGFDAIVTIHTRSMPFLHGYPVYFAAVLKTILFNHNPFHLSIEMDGRPWDLDSLMIVLCNGKREGGGFHLAPDSEPTDGVMSYLGLQRISRLQMLRTLVHFMRGTQFSLPHIKSGSFKEIRVESDKPLVIHLDGEIFAGFNSRVKSFKASILPAALQAVL